MQAELLCASGHKGFHLMSRPTISCLTPTADTESPRSPMRTAFLILAVVALTFSQASADLAGQPLGGEIIIDGPSWGSSGGSGTGKAGTHMELGRKVSIGRSHSHKETLRAPVLVVTAQPCDGATHLDGPKWFSPGGSGPGATAAGITFQDGGTLKVRGIVEERKGGGQWKGRLTYRCGKCQAFIPSVGSTASFPFAGPSISRFLPPAAISPLGTPSATSRLSSQTVARRQFCLRSPRAITGWGLGPQGSSLAGARCRALEYSTGASMLPMD